MIRDAFLYLIENLGTIIPGMIVAGIVAAIVAKIVRDRQKGKCAGCDCGCGCEGCSSSLPLSTKPNGLNQ